jgi:hypothetical protein
MSIASTASRKGSAANASGVDELEQNMMHEWKAYRYTRVKEIRQSAKNQANTMTASALYTVATPVQISAFKHNMQCVNC